MHRRSLLILLTALCVAACERPAPEGGGPAPAGEAPGAPAADVPPGAQEACPGIAQLDTTSAEVCTRIGCLDGFEVAVRNVPHDAPGWPHGTYSYTVTVDGAVVECHGALPLPPCGQPGMRCASDLVSVAEVGCALPPDSQAFGGLHFERAYPRKVELVIERDGQRLLEETLTPDYSAVQPNGPGCGPVCCQARAGLEVALSP